VITTLQFRSVCFDTQILRAGSPPDRIPFLTGDAEPGDAESSVVTIAEKELVRWLFARKCSNALMCTELKIAEGAQLHFSVEEPVLERRNLKPGDIDFLAVHTERPHEAIAAEFKRVKVTALDEHRERTNKVEGLGRGVSQANALADLGFHKCYLVVVIQVDGRTRTGLNVLSRGVNPQTMRQVYEFPLREGLTDDVGVAFVEVVQPSPRAYSRMAKIGICVDRRARPREQRQDITNRVRALLRRA